MEIIQTVLLQRQEHSGRRGGIPGAEASEHPGNGSNQFLSLFTAPFMAGEYHISVTLLIMLLIVMFMGTGCAADTGAGGTGKPGTPGSASESGTVDGMGKPGTPESASESGTVGGMGKPGTPDSSPGMESTKIQSGSYVPASFSVRGGTGRVKITCPEVTAEEPEASAEKGGHAESSSENKDVGSSMRTEALLVFDSPHYEWVRTGGVQYSPVNGDDPDRRTSEFRIPVILEEEMEVIGLTRAMSEPHEIIYTIRISLAGTEEKAGREAEGKNGTEAGRKIGAESEEKAGREAEGKNETEAGRKIGAESEEKAGREAEGNNGTEAGRKIGAESEEKAGKESEEKAGREAEGKNGTEAGRKVGAESEEKAETEEKKGEEAAGQLKSFSQQDADQSAEPPEIAGLRYVSAMSPAYAQAFDIYYYEKEGKRDGSSEGEFCLIDVYGSAQYLLVPEGEEVPQEIPDGILVLHAPLQRIYVAATSSMALFDAAGALDQVKLTGTDVKGWYIDAPRKALEDGRMAYAGKYSSPDYEMLTASGCSLAVESTMILHVPEVKEKLEELGIPVFIDVSSTESHPLGRTEWVRLYGVLTGHREEADVFFKQQEAKISEAEAYEDTGKTVAFFSISSSGNVIVRASDDYIPCMISLAGGRYVFSDLGHNSGSSASVRLSMESFYSQAKDADYLIYNSTIESPLHSLEELVGKSGLFADFKAVQKGNLWQIRRNLYQSPDIAAEMITDLHEMLAGDGQKDMVFLEKVK